ncbi:cobalamin biosynthesis protein, partial [Streptomyces sp. 8N706]|uniref:cobalamin biosynthesis protein n=1 Tax=Streptomyces sp. 8N706 TaxID=3457416 RepID=UPI003FD0DBCA
RRHPSPNAGPVESAFAGALGVRLGGTLAYAGRTEHRPVLGGENRPVAVRDIERAVRLSRRVNLLALAACVGGRLLWSALRPGDRAGTVKPASPQSRSALRAAAPGAVAALGRRAAGAPGGGTRIRRRTSGGVTGGRLPAAGRGNV